MDMVTVFFLNTRLSVQVRSLSDLQFLGHYFVFHFLFAKIFKVNGLCKRHLLTRLRCLPVF
jgi:hypothetical protein